MTSNRFPLAAIAIAAFFLLTAHTGGSCGEPPPLHCDSLPPERCAADPSCELVPAEGDIPTCACACLPCPPDGDCQPCKCDCPPPPVACHPKLPCDQLGEADCLRRGECRALYTRDLHAATTRDLAQDPGSIAPDGASCPAFRFARCENGPTCPVTTCRVMCAPGYRVQIDANGCETCSCEPVDPPPPCPAMTCLCPEGTQEVREKTTEGCEICRCE